MLTGIYTRLTQWCNCEWPWTTLSDSKICNDMKRRAASAPQLSILSFQLWVQKHTPWSLDSDIQYCDDCKRQMSVYATRWPVETEDLWTPAYRRAASLQSRPTPDADGRPPTRYTSLPAARDPPLVNSPTKSFLFPSQLQTAAPTARWRLYRISPPRPFPTAVSVVAPPCRYSAIGQQMNRISFAQSYHVVLYNSNYYRTTWSYIQDAQLWRRDRTTRRVAE